MKQCFRCYHYGEPLRQYNQNAKLWYMGCAKCGCGVFFS